MSKVGVKVAAFASSLLLAVLVWGGVGQAQSQSPDSTLDALVGEKAVVFLRDFPVVERREIIQLHGTVSAVVDQGMWFKPVNRRFKVDKKGDENRAYTGTLFVPWTSVSYMKLIRGNQAETKPPKKR